MTDDIVARLRSRSPYLDGSSAERVMDEAADEIERLKAWLLLIAEEAATVSNRATVAQFSLRVWEGEVTTLRADIARLRAALKPFAVPDKVSLIDTLGHIGREEIANARAALEPKP
jgi:hypothetical protein